MFSLDAFPLFSVMKWFTNNNKMLNFFLEVQRIKSTSETQIMLYINEIKPVSDCLDVDRVKMVKMVNVAGRRGS